MAGRPWYKRYEQYRAEVEERRTRFYERCIELGADPNTVAREIQTEIIARAVQESNWQEGLYLDDARTRQITDEVFRESLGSNGPRLDMERIICDHTQKAKAMKDSGVSVEELATYNLAVAHKAIEMIGMEQTFRLLTAYDHVGRKVVEAVKRNRNFIEKHVQGDFDIDEDIKALQEAIDGAEEFLSSHKLLPFPLNEADITTLSDLYERLRHIKLDNLLHSMTVDYIHFLHRITLAEIIPEQHCGVFRKDSVTVGDPTVIFAAPSLVPGLMQEYCQTFPVIAPGDVPYDPIMQAALSSHKFVRIHPYADGNGRVSRLLMTLILWGHHPPVYLKADKEGRKRYIYALRRANRGDIEGLACLIALSLRDIYDRLLESVYPDIGNK